MSLNERLAALTAQFKSAMSADESAVVEQAAELLRRSGIADRAVKVGQAAPDFTLKDEDGTSVSLAQTREKGPVIVTFYRGVWCPYCNEDLKALQAALPTFRSMGASLISISPQSPANSRKSKRDNGLDYPILSDQGNAVADRYGLHIRSRTISASSTFAGASTWKHSMAMPVGGCRYRVALSFSRTV
jgi:peroxiredoxin